jgi:hypothetical protein
MTEEMESAIKQQIHFLLKASEAWQKAKDLPAVKGALGDDCLALDLIEGRCAELMKILFPKKRR